MVPFGRDPADMSDLCRSGKKLWQTWAGARETMAASTGRKVISADQVTLGPAAEAAVRAGRLNRAQAGAAFITDRPALILGPPGTGKTTTLVEHIGALLDRGMSLDRIICSSFTAASSQELTERVRAKFPDLMTKAIRNRTLCFGTLNSLGSRLLKVMAGRPEAGLGGGDGSVQVLRDHECAALARKLGIDLGKKQRGSRTGDANGKKGGADVADKKPTAEDLGWYGPGIAGELSSPGSPFGGDAIPGTNPLAERAESKGLASDKLGKIDTLSFLEVVNHWKINLIRPEDAVAIAEGKQGYVADEVLAKRANDYKRYIDAMREDGVIDFTDQIVLPIWIMENCEPLRTAFQRRWDTFIVDEYQDVNPAMGALVDMLSAVHRRPWCVGDPDQTIYEFNGSSPQYILEFGSRWPDAETIALEANHRSQPPIITAANLLIRNNKARYETFLSATKPNVALSPEIGRALMPNSRHIPVEARAIRECAIEVTTFADDFDEAASIAIKVKALLDIGVPASQIAVFFRSLFRSYHLVQALRGAGVKLRLVRGSDSSDFEEGQLVEGLLKAVFYPAPGASDLMAIQRQIGGGAERVKRLMGASSDLQNKGLADPARWTDLCQAVMSILGNEVTIANAAERSGARRLTSARLQSTLQGAIDAGSFAAWMAAEPLAGRDSAANAGDRVTLGSIHSSKGLEFDHVFLPGLEDDCCPCDGEIANEEERRLFYVGLTRARVTVSLSHANFRQGDKDHDRSPSPYIEEACHGTPGIQTINCDPEAAPNLEDLSFDTLSTTTKKKKNRRGLDVPQAMPAPADDELHIHSDALEAARIEARAGAAALPPPDRPPQAVPPGIGSVSPARVVPPAIPPMPRPGDTKGTVPGPLALPAANQTRPNPTPALPVSVPAAMPSRHPSAQAAPAGPIHLDLMTIGGGAVCASVVHLSVVNRAANRNVLTTPIKPEGDWLALSFAEESMPNVDFNAAPPLAAVMAKLRSVVDECAKQAPVILRVRDHSVVIALGLGGVSTNPRDRVSLTYFEQASGQR